MICEGCRHCILISKPWERLEIDCRYDFEDLSEDMESCESFEEPSYNEWLDALEGRSGY